MYIAVCRYEFTNWGIYDTTDNINWTIDNYSTSRVLYDEDNIFDCIRFKI